MSSEPSRPRILAPPALLAAVCVASGVVLQHYRPLPFLPDALLLRIVASLLLFGTFGLILLSTLHSFRQRQTTVNPYGRPTNLVSTGLYRFSRNPIYVGLLLLVLGFAFALDSGWLIAATALLLALLHFGVVKPEERVLRSQFGSEYEDFAARVRRWL